VKRRNHALTAEKIIQRDLRASTNRDISELALLKTAQVQQMKEQAKSQKDLIGYKEYVQVRSISSQSMLRTYQTQYSFVKILV
jgi:hypothetical protein